MQSGVRQGGVLSPHLFAIYIDDLILQLRRLKNGCHIADLFLACIVYADDISLVNGTSRDTKSSLKAVFDAGAFDAFKFKPKKCKIIGADKCDHTTFYTGDEEIKRVNSGILLGAVIDKRGIDILSHVRRRADMVRNAIRQLKSWRTGIAI